MVAVGLAEDVDAAGVDGIFFYIIRKLRHSVVRRQERMRSIYINGFRFQNTIQGYAFFVKADGFKQAELGIAVCPPGRGQLAVASAEIARGSIGKEFDIIQVKSDIGGPDIPVSRRFRA